MAPSDIIKKYFRSGVVLDERYQIEKLIGAGAYSAIFSAIDSHTGQRVAIKAVPPINDGGKKTSIGRFQREMKVIGNMRHENIISLFDFGETEELIGYMVLEYIQGRTLFDIVDGHPMTTLTAIDVTRQIALALRVAHGKGIIHRDLKPQNVMLIPKGDDYLVKVLDFGMAKLTQNVGGESIKELTREGIAVGTPRYIAPEQARGKKVGPYSDLYALGLLMYEMFTGERAVKADTIESAIRTHVSSKPHAFEELGLIPLEMHDVLYKLTSKPISKRYQNAEELIIDLNQIEKIFKLDPTIVHSFDDDPTTAFTREQANQSLVEYRNRNPQPQTIKGKEKKEKTIFPPISLSSFDGVGLIFLFIVGPLSFLSLSSHLTGWSYLPRFFIALLPIWIALLTLLVGKKWGRALPFTLAQRAVLLSVFAILGSHIFAPGDLGIGLWNDSTWFLAPFSSIPGVDSLSEFVKNMSRVYVNFLISLSSTFSPR